MVFAALAWMAGYAVVVACSFALTFGVALTVPGFVVQGGRMNNAYIVVQGAIWTLCSVAGGFAVGGLATAFHPSLMAALLAVAIIAINWLNAGDTGRQDGLPYRLVTSSLTFIGVMAGYLLSARH